MTHSTCFTEIGSPVGRLLLVADRDGLRHIGFLDGQGALGREPDWKASREPFGEAVRQLKAYFAGELHTFALDLALRGTPFQMTVWSQLCKIPYGRTISYGELAASIGKPKASRAVGLANGANPIPIVIPCHRVIGANGQLTGYGGGLPIKEKLLALEQRQATLY
jgi:methylated-DNA-[protein]-cysteine S-methyltransferase